MIEYLILSILFASAAFLSRSRRAVDIAAGCFFGVQVVLAALLVSDARGSAIWAYSRSIRSAYCSTF